MPIYEYTCDSCGEDFELLVRGSDTPSCPECQGTELTRRISLPRVHSETTHSLAMRAAKRRDSIQARENSASCGESVTRVAPFDWISGSMV